MSIPLRRAQGTASPKTDSPSLARVIRPRASFNPRHFVYWRYPLLPPIHDYTPTRDHPGPPPTRFYLADEALRFYDSIREDEHPHKIIEDRLTWAECGNCPHSVAINTGYLTSDIGLYTDPDPEADPDRYRMLYKVRPQDIYNVLIEHSLHRLDKYVPELQLFRDLRQHLRHLPKDQWESGEKLCADFTVNLHDSIAKSRKLKFRIDRQLHARCVDIANSLGVYRGSFIVLMILDSMRAFKVQAVESMNQSVETFYSQLRSRAAMLGAFYVANGNLPESCRQDYEEIFRCKL